jgi:hypothetical protein
VQSKGGDPHQIRDMAASNRWEAAISGILQRSSGPS